MHYHYSRNLWFLSISRKCTLTSLLALLLSMTPSHVSAQVGDARNEFAIGVNGGMVMDKITFEPTIKQTFKPGASCGITARYTCEKYFNLICAIQSELNYAQMGWKEVIETSSDTYERTINYLQVPFLARLGIGKEKRGLMGYLILGPQIGFCLGDSDKRSGEWSNTTLNKRPNHIIQQYELDIQHKFDYGITGGLGLEFSTTIGHFMAEGRYYFGLSDIFNNGKTDTFGRSAHGAIVAKITYLVDL